MNKLTLASGSLRKMSATLNPIVEYHLALADKKIFLNDYLGKEISLTFNGKINCISCNRLLKKSYQQGYCFPCTQKLAACDLCILKPERCHYQHGTCREPAWGKQHCFKPHIVYLANTSGLKVGITRKSQVPTRWIDQGAIAALPIIQVQSRYQSGLIEIKIAESIADKTNWRKMLQGNIEPIDLAVARDKLLSAVAESIQEISSKFNFGEIEILTSEEVVNLNYPVINYPEKIKSLNLDKNPLITGVLQGIKGQYLILDCGVLNIRNFSGYQVELDVVD